MLVYSKTKRYMAESKKKVVIVPSQMPANMLME